MKSVRANFMSAALDATNNCGCHVSCCLDWVISGRRHVKFTFSGKRLNTVFIASALLAGLNTSPFENLNPGSDIVGIGGIGICGRAGRLGVVMFSWTACCLSANNSKVNLRAWSELCQLHKGRTRPTASHCNNQ